MNLGHLTQLENKAMSAIVRAMIKLEDIVSLSDSRPELVYDKLQNVLGPKINEIYSHEEAIDRYYSVNGAVNPTAIDRRRAGRACFIAILEQAMGHDVNEVTYKSVSTQQTVTVDKPDKAMADLFRTDLPRIVACGIDYK